MIQKINYLFTRAFDIILYPFSFISEFWGILFLSIIMSFIVLWLYKWISSPRLVREAKDQIKANILAIRLYKDSGLTIIVSFFKSLLYTFKYFGLNMLPLLLIVPILFPAFVQMDIRYGLRPFQPGEEIVVKAKLESDLHGLNIQLLENDHFKPKMKPVFIKALKEANWKLEALEPGNFQLQVKVDDVVYEKTVWIGKTNSATAYCDKKMRDSSWDYLIYPAEKPLPKGEVESIYLEYPKTDISFAGIKTPWWVYNILLVLIIVLALKNRFGIEF